MASEKILRQELDYHFGGQARSIVGGANSEGVMMVRGKCGPALGNQMARDTDFVLCPEYNGTLWRV